VFRPCSAKLPAHLSIMDEARDTCALCNRTVSALLYHLRVRHNIQSIEDYSGKVRLLEEEVARRLEFRKYVEELKAAMERKEITAEEYRRRVVDWERSRHAT
jgi:Fe-S oxidoreductase